MVLAELMAHKRIDVAVRRSTRSGCRCWWSATGPSRAISAHRRARRSASPAGSATSGSPSCCSAARALVVTATEEFGIAAVEALAAGRPVIALGEGGVRESVTEGVTGAFFAPCEPEALAEAVAALRPRAVDPAACRAAAERFGADRFRAELARIVAEAVAGERPPRDGERGAGRGLAGFRGRRRLQRGAHGS